MAEPGQESRSHDFRFCVCVKLHINKLPLHGGISGRTDRLLRQHLLAPLQSLQVSDQPSYFYFRKFVSVKALPVHSTD